MLEAWQVCFEPTKDMGERSLKENLEVRESSHWAIEIRRG